MKFLITADGTVLPFMYYEEFRDGILLLKDGTSGTKSFLVIPSENQEDNQLQYGVACMYDSEYGPLTTENFDKYQVFVDILESYTLHETCVYAGLLKYWKKDIKREHELVIVVQDDSNSYFCGIDKTNHVLLSTDIRKAIKYPSDDSDALDMLEEVAFRLQQKCFIQDVEKIGK